MCNNSFFVSEILCRNCRRHQLPDLVASLPPTADRDIPRSSAIDIPGSGGRRRESVVYSTPSSPESIGQELRRIGDDFDRHFGSSAEGAATGVSSLNTGRSRSFSFVSRILFSFFLTKRKIKLLIFGETLSFKSEPNLSNCIQRWLYVA